MTPSSNTLPNLLLPEEGNTPPLTPSDIDTAPNDVVRSSGDTVVSEDNLRDALAQVGAAKDVLQAELEATKKRVRTIEILDELIEPMAKRAFWFMCI